MAHFGTGRPLLATLLGATLLALSGGLVPLAAAGCEDHKDAANSCEREGVFACNPPVGGKCYTTHILTKFNCECLTKRPSDTKPERERETPPRDPGLERPLVPLPR
jgi:hypothetical protein